VAWVLPELDVGAVAELLLELGELELAELELAELELAEPAPDVFDVAEESEEAAVCVEPGRAKATAPAVSTLATPTPVVTKRTLALPRFLAATALSSLSPLSPFMSLVSDPGLHGPCALPLR
jgi:hypothetical protein